MKKVCLLLSILALTLTVGAQKPVPMAAYLSLSAGTWNPWTSSGGFGSLSFTPPAIGLYCQATSGGPWQPCNPGSGSGGNATSIQGNPVAAIVPTVGQTLVWNGTAWTPGTGGGGHTSVTIEHAFTGAGTFSYAHNLGTSYPLMTCYVNSGSVAYSASNPDVNDIAITVPTAADITCTFGI